MQSVMDLKQIQVPVNGHYGGPEFNGWSILCSELDLLSGLCHELEHSTQTLRQLFQ